MRNTQRDWMFQSLISGMDKSMQTTLNMMYHNSMMIMKNSVIQRLKRSLKSQAMRLKLMSPKFLIVTLSCRSKVP